MKTIYTLAFFSMSLFALLSCKNQSVAIGEKPEMVNSYMQPMDDSNPPYEMVLQVIGAAEKIDTDSSYFTLVEIKNIGKHTISSVEFWGDIFPDPHIEIKKRIKPNEILELRLEGHHLPYENIVPDNIKGIAYQNGAFSTTIRIDCDN